MLWNVGSLHVYERHFDIVAVKESAWV
jgi:thymidylate synthase